MFHINAYIKIRSIYKKPVVTAVGGNASRNTIFGGLNRCKIIKSLDEKVKARSFDCKICRFRGYIIVLPIR